MITECFTGRLCDHEELLRESDCLSLKGLINLCFAVFAFLWLH